MQLILNIDDELLKDMQFAAELKNKPLNEMVSELFATFIGDPQKTIHDAYDNDSKGFELFNKLLFSYLTEAIEDVQESAGSSEAYASASDNRMIEVFKKLRDEILSHDHVVATLYEAFKTAK